MAEVFQVCKKLQQKCTVTFKERKNCVIWRKFQTINLLAPSTKIPMALGGKVGRILGKEKSIAQNREVQTVSPEPELF